MLIYTALNREERGMLRSPICDPVCVFITCARVGVLAIGLINH